MKDVSVQGGDKQDIGEERMVRKGIFDMRLQGWDSALRGQSQVKSQAEQEFSLRWWSKTSIAIFCTNIGEKRMFVNNILRRKANWVGHILRRNFLLHYAIEGQMTGEKMDTIP